MSNPQAYARYIHQGLKPLGLSDAQVAGIIGNFKAEGGSDLNPARNEGGVVGPPGSGPGYGWAQWTGPRRDALIRFAGGPTQAMSAEAQLNFLKRELQTSESAALNALKRARTPQEAALIFQDKFERPGVPTPGKRVGYAQKAYEWITGGGSPATAPVAPAPARAPVAAPVQRWAGMVYGPILEGADMRTTPSASTTVASALPPPVGVNAPSANAGTRDSILYAAAMQGLTGLQSNPAAFRLPGLPSVPMAAAPAATPSPAAGQAAAPAAATGGGFEKPLSTVFEGPGGQPGLDAYFASKNFPAVLGGRVKDVRRESGYGNFVVVESPSPTGGKPVDVLYGHLADGSTTVRPGDTVAPGQIIGQQGGTGNVRSADGTIASIDFLAPAPAGSGSMTPHPDFDRIRRLVAKTLAGAG